MSKTVKDLTSDQLRRIFRDYLKGVPKERLMKKYDIGEGEFWEIVGMYSKKKHPNDVGNASDIQGPADLLVSPMDTGATATEHPIIARSPKDLRTTQDTEVKEFDYDSPEEELRKKGGEVNDILAKRAADKAKEDREAAREEIKENKETTDAIYKELAEVSASETDAKISQAAESAKATPPVEEVTRLAREAREAQLIADSAAEDAALAANQKHAEENAERDQKLVEEGEKQVDELMKKQDEARKKEAEERAAKAPELQQEAKDAGEDLKRATEPVKLAGAPQGSGEAGAPQQPGGSGQGTAGDRQASQAGGEAVAPAVPVANTSKTDQPTPVQPAKVEPGKLKG